MVLSRLQSNALEAIIIHEIGDAHNECLSNEDSTVEDDEHSEEEKEEEEEEEGEQEEADKRRSEPVVSVSKYVHLLYSVCIVICNISLDVP